MRYVLLCRTCGDRELARDDDRFALSDVAFEQQVGPDHFAHDLSIELAPGAKPPGLQLPKVPRRYRTE